MKKKGLIISSIVMVVVLIASLTTATYAWFNTSSVTKIDAFNVQVSTSNLVKIGVKTNNTYKSSDLSENDFKTGEVAFGSATAGTLASGEWSGDINGLSATISHNIKWGAQTKAVAFTDTKITALDSADSTTGTVSGLALGSIDSTHKTYVYAANGDGVASSTALSNVTKAIANNDGAESPAEPSSDYVHLFLGASPTTALTSNELIIMLDSNASTSTTLGILAAVHVAYRLNSAGAWTDAELFGSSKHFGDLRSSVTDPLTADERATYVATYGSSPTLGTTGLGAVKITGLATAVGSIDQIELLIYIDGCDSDCLTSAISNIQGKISIFFHAVAVSA